jgi:hypothetical protein
MNAARDEDKRIKPASKWLGRRAEALVDATAPLLAEEYARTIFVLIEPVAPSPRWSRAHEQGHTRELSVLIPTLGFDALPFFRRHMHEVITATVPTTVTIPVLHDG